MTLIATICDDQICKHFDAYCSYFVLVCNGSKLNPPPKKNPTKNPVNCSNCDLCISTGAPQRYSKINNKNKV